ncbi:MAG: SAM-dependent methyltransferase [Deltaproteobacteria bacterium]|nr:SAM-dependent methyltransferase [Deltaproteobacteria bacterium]
MSASQNTRIVHCEDALAWLEAQPVQQGCSFITSMPDVSEFPKLTLEEWKSWFTAAAALVLSRCPDDGVAIFYQTDIKVDGAWVDKSFLVQKAAEQTGHALLWHKMVCRSNPGLTTYGRPGYSHLLCFSKIVRIDLARCCTDVLPQAGDTTWKRGMGTEACLHACRFVLENTATRTIVAPFCGHGTVLAVANQLGLGGIGIERSPKRARKARAVTFEGNQLQCHPH